MEENLTRATGGLTDERPLPQHAETQEPARVGPLFVLTFALAQLTFFVALLGPVTVSMAIKLTALVGPVAAPRAQGLVLGLGSVAALVANPVFGRLSDACTSRFGRRRPFLVGGSVALAGCLVVVAVADEVAVVAAAWFGAQLAANACFAAYLSTIADQVPPAQTARISALAGVMQASGILAATGLASLFTENLFALFMIPAAVGVAGMTLYALLLPDRPISRHGAPARIGLLPALRTFWVSPVAHPDFARVWASRCLLTLGSFMFSSFRFFWVRDHLGLDAVTAARSIFGGVLCYTVALIVVGQLVGFVSDRIGRRKLFVIGSTIVYSAGLALLTQVSSVQGFYGVEVILGAAFGTFLGVDLALVLSVLPDRENMAKDLGVFNIASAAPQTFAPLLGSLLLGGRPCATTSSTRAPPP